jgi:hypothetical protein
MWVRILVDCYLSYAVTDCNTHMRMSRKPLHGVSSSGNKRVESVSIYAEMNRINCILIKHVSHSIKLCDSEHLLYRLHCTKSMFLC